MGNDLPVTGTYLRPGPKPKFSDIEIIALSLTAEATGIISENHLFHILNSDYKLDFPNILSRRQYNDRLKNLFKIIEHVRNKIVSIMNHHTDVFAIDSMPMEICKLSREHRSTFSKGHDFESPGKGFCASQNRYFYGYKLHAICSPVGVIQQFDLSNAKIHDVHYLKDISHTFRNCIITGDRGYISASIKKSLLEKCNISLQVPGRSNQNVKVKVPKTFRIVRKRIETIFSQLCAQFRIQINYAKQFTRYKTRILSKITAMTVLQYLNYLRGIPVGKIKTALSDNSYSS
ncbi:IS982 family transposase [Pedobacter sp. N23S346]